MKLNMGSRRKRKKGDTAQLANLLAPLEEQDKSSAAKQGGISPHLGDPQLDPHYGAIVVDNEGLHVPKDIMEGGDEGTFLGMEPVVLVILAVMLAFIVFIAWQISHMPVEGDTSGYSRPANSLDLLEFTQAVQSSSSLESKL